MLILPLSPQLSSFPVELPILHPYNYPSSLSSSTHPCSSYTSITIPLRPQLHTSPPTSTKLSPSSQPKRFATKSRYIPSTPERQVLKCPPQKGSPKKGSTEMSSPKKGGPEAQPPKGEYRGGEAPSVAMWPQGQDRDGREAGEGRMVFLARSKFSPLRPGQKNNRSVRLRCGMRILA